MCVSECVTYPTCKAAPLGFQTSAQLKTRRDETKVNTITKTRRKTKTSKRPEQS